MTEPLRDAIARVLLDQHMFMCELLTPDVKHVAHAILADPVVSAHLRAGEAMRKAAKRVAERHRDNWPSETPATQPVTFEFGDAPSDLASLVAAEVMALPWARGGDDDEQVDRHGDVQGAAERVIAASRTSSGWQPVETAPKDGTRVDVWVDWSDGDASRVTDAYWNSKCWQLGLYSENQYKLRPRVTHWMHRPPPPQEEKSDG